MGNAPAIHPAPVVDVLGLTGRVETSDASVELDTAAMDPRNGFVARTCITPEGEYIAYPVAVGPAATVGLIADYGGRDQHSIEAIADIPRLLDAGITPRRLYIPQPPPPYTQVFAIGWAITEHQGGRCHVSVFDSLGASAALVPPTGLDGVVLPGRKALEKSRRATPELYRAVHAGEILAEGTRWPGATKRAVLASAVLEYLEKETWGPSDRGRPPVEWLVAKNGEVIACSAPADHRAKLGRLARLRSHATAALSVDVTGRTRLEAIGSSRRHVPVYLPTDDGEGIEIVGYGPADWDRFARQRVDWVGYEGVRPRATAIDRVLQWTDPTGNDAAALVDLLRLYDLAGLTERQLAVYILDEDGWRSEEIAKALKCASSTVRNTLVASRRKLAAARAELRQKRGFEE